jgi:hypothetical protein
MPLSPGERTVDLSIHDISGTEVCRVIIADDLQCT